MNCEHHDALDADREQVPADSEIVALYFAREERAIEETQRKYGRYCFSIAFGLLGNEEDAEECVNDTYASAWNCIPPHKPSGLAGFLGKIVRRIAVDRVRYRNAEKRSCGELLPILDELKESLPDATAPSPAEELDREALARRLNDFLYALPDIERRVFVCRYYYGDSIAALAESFGFAESRVKSMLYRTRKKLRVCLEKEDFA